MSVGDCWHDSATNNKQTIYCIMLYYTQVGRGDRLDPPGGRPGARCRVVWGAGTPTSEASGGQRPPGSLKCKILFL